MGFCRNRKNLDSKTIKAYGIDLKQYIKFVASRNIEWNKKASIEIFLDQLYTQYKPKSIKRKIASIKAFFHYLELENIIEANPFHKIQIKYKEPFILPKTIPIISIGKLIVYAYDQQKEAVSKYEKKVTLRNVLIIELLFATGMRISELCSLKMSQFDFNDYIIKIYGKGSKERLIQICNVSVQQLIDKYIVTMELNEDDYFFKQVG